ncbi:hypothetical protein PMAYCL1PPCAC_28632, partial [Pristionchus mayeri]
GERKRKRMMKEKGAENSNVRVEDTEIVEEQPDETMENSDEDDDDVSMPEDDAFLIGDLLNSCDNEEAEEEMNARLEGDQLEKEVTDPAAAAASV